MKEELRSNGKLRLPPGQHIAKRFPVFQKGNVIHLDRKTYKLTLEGEIENPMTFTLKDLEKLSQIFIVSHLGANLIQNGVAFLFLHFLKL
jgi:DMSO/TMAO reductase YedYZ molybdopterin-dependent catalytic subunit